MLQALIEGKNSWFYSVIYLYMSSFDLQNDVKVDGSTFKTSLSSWPSFLFWMNEGTGLLSISDSWLNYKYFTQESDF